MIRPLYKTPSTLFGILFSENRRMGPRRVMNFLAVAAVMATTGLPAADPVAGNHRLATYGTPAGDRYFALSVQPSADDGLLQAARSRPANIVVVIDTSASQVGAYREATLSAVRSLVKQLRAEDAVKLYAVDVNAAPLSEAFGQSNEPTTQAALAKLQRRLPLGNTNLASALHAARVDLVGKQSTRSIIYIGDGSSLGEIRSEDRFAMLVDALRADKISVHNIAIGPTTNVELLATLSNQTGGLTFVPGEDNLAQSGALGRQAADAASTAPMWLDNLQLPAGLQTVQADRLPPVRVDRDTVLIGQINGTTDGLIAIEGQVSNVPFQVHVSATAEPSNPDFAFLPGMVNSCSHNSGLMLPTPGSWALREVARAMTFRADQMVESGTLALKQGNARGAGLVADLALQIDPNNQRAQAMSRLAADEKTLTTMLQGEGNLEDPPAPPRGGFGALGPDEMLEEPSGLLGRTLSDRDRNTGRLIAEVRAGLAAAQRQMARDPVQVTESLKTLQAIVESEPEIDPEAREELLGQVRSALQVASARTRAFIEDQQSIQQRVAAGEAVERLLAETFRNEARIGQLSQQLNAVMREGRYDEAANAIAPDLATLAGPERVISQHALEHSHIAATVRRHIRYQNLRERAFVDALSLVEKAFIPFIDEPPIVYPDAEVWQRLSRRRLERYGSLDLSGDNPVERRIYAALEDETTAGPFIEESLENVVRQLSELHDIPIRVDIRSLEEIGLSGDVPVSSDLKGTSLRSYLRLMLEELDLTYMIKDEVLKITTTETAEANLVTKVYPV